MLDSQFGFTQGVSTVIVAFRSDNAGRQKCVQPRAMELHNQSPPKKE